MIKKKGNILIIKKELIVRQRTSLSRSPRSFNGRYNRGNDSRLVTETDYEEPLKTNESPKHSEKIVVKHQVLPKVGAKQRLSINEAIYKIDKSKVNFAAGEPRGLSPKAKCGQSYDRKNSDSFLGNKESIENEYGTLRRQKSDNNMLSVRRNSLVRDRSNSLIQLQPGRRGNSQSNRLEVPKVVKAIHENLMARVEAVKASYMEAVP